MTDLKDEKFMIQVRILAAGKNLVDDNRVAKRDVTVRQTAPFFSDSPVGQLKIIKFSWMQND